MSLNRGPLLQILNSYGADTVTVASGVISIQGWPSFATADILRCYRECKTACTKQQTTVLPVIPTAPCECPWTFEMKITGFGQAFGRVQTTFDWVENYNYVKLSGDLPTATEVATSIEAQILSNPHSHVTVTRSGATLTIIEKECGDTMTGTLGFKVTATSATIVDTVAHVNAILPDHVVQQDWPVTHNMPFSNPSALTAFCGGSYCVYYFKLRPHSVLRDPHVSNAYVDVELEFLLYVSNTLSNFSADVDTPLGDAVDCFDPLP